MTGDSKGRRRGLLSAEDRALWEKVKATAKPLRKSPAGRTPTAEPAVTGPEAPSKPAGSATAPGEPPPEPTATAALPVRERGPTPARLDRRTVQRIARGATAIDSRIDLHGMTQARAHDRLQQFLVAAQARGDRLVLVITGKGSQRGAHDAFFDEAGVLRRAVPLWLAERGFRELVAGWQTAHRSHGGDGALYVRLRRPR